MVPGGEVDVAVAPVVDARITELHDAGFPRVVLDLRQVTFMDVCALRVVLKWANAARADRTTTFAVVPGPPHVQRIFTLTGTADLVDFVRPGERAHRASRRPA